MTDTERMNALQALGRFDVRVEGTEGGDQRVLFVMPEGTAYDGANLRECVDQLPAPPADTWRTLPSLWRTQGPIPSGPAMVLHDGFLYVVGMTQTGFKGQAHIAKINAATGETRVLAMDNTDGRHRNPTRLCVLNGKLYVVMGLNGFLLVEVDPGDLSYRDVVWRPEYGNNSRGSIATNGSVLWCALGGPAGRLIAVKYDGVPATFKTRTNQNCVRMDGATPITTHHDPARITHFGAEEKLLTDLDPDYNSICDHFALTDDGAIWCGMDSRTGIDPGTRPLTGTRFRIPKDDLSKAVAFPPLHVGFTKGVFEDAHDPRYVYQTFAGDPGKLLRFTAAAPHAEAGRWQLAEGQDCVALVFAEDRVYSLSGNGVVAAHSREVLR